MSRDKFTLFRIIIRIVILILPCTPLLSQQINFNWDWKFYKGDLTGEPWQADYPIDSWREVVVPHNPPFSFNQPDPDRPTWESGYSYEGISWYRKNFTLDPGYSGKKIFIHFEAVNTVADIWINGHHVTQHIGGYLPFIVDITDHAYFGDSANNIVVRADNTDNPEIPIGNTGWFNWGGIYRDVHLIIKDKLHITNPVYANIPAGGGIFITYPSVDPSIATINIKTHVINEHADQISCTLISEICDQEGITVKSLSQLESIGPGTGFTFQQNTSISDPQLWHPDAPFLYTLKSYVLNQTDTVDTQITKFGIRSVKFTRANGFELNGEVFQFRGANRMQDFPYVGYAMPDAAQVRDIRLLKDAGFQYLRLSQYPQDPSVLDACDKYGVIAMVPIPGFQHIGGSGFKQISYQNMRDMIRRDRNHPCIIAWELSLNETWWTDPEYSPNAHIIGHEEYPGDQCYIAGWKDDDVYDIYIATPNAGARSYVGSKPLIISEHGHWQFGGANSSSDVNREDGEQRMLRQELNHRSSLGQNLALENLCGDGLWAGIDLAQYPSGVLDNFRLPKFVHYFWQSQRDPEKIIPGLDSGPMVFIANYWTENSPGDIKVYSNCDEVELYLNDLLIEKRIPDGGFTNSFIPHPPFTFSGVDWEAGELKAIGYIDGIEQASHTVKTPGQPAYIELIVDTVEYKLVQGVHNILFAYASILDDQGVLVPDANTTIQFSMNGPGEPVSPTEIQAEAGIATFFIRTGRNPGTVNIGAQSKINKISLSGFTSFEVSPDLIDKPVITISAQNDVILGSEDSSQIDVRLWGDYFHTSLTKTNWRLDTLPEGVLIDTIIITDSVHATLKLSGNSSGIHTDIANINLTVNSDELVKTDTGVLHSIKGIIFRAPVENKVYVTLQVDMTGIYLQDGVFINGEITDDWSFERLYHEGDNIYSITYHMKPVSTTSYAYYNGTSWEEDEKEAIPPGCALMWGTHRLLNVPSHDTVIGYTYATCLPTGHGPNEIISLTDPAHRINVYPNPAKDWLKVTSSHSFESIVVSDMTGRIIYSDHALHVNNTSLNMSSYPAGLYILRVIFDDGFNCSVIVNLQGL